jgi:hypothetical protein
MGVLCAYAYRSAATRAVYLRREPIGPVHGAEARGLHRIAALLDDRRAGSPPRRVAGQLRAHLARRGALEADAGQRDDVGQPVGDCEITGQDAENLRVEIGRFVCPEGRTVVVIKSGS